jgi:hypothetical protein
MLSVKRLEFISASGEGLMNDYRELSGRLLQARWAQEWRRTGGRKFVQSVYIN